MLDPSRQQCEFANKMDKHIMIEDWLLIVLVLRETPNTRQLNFLETRNLQEQVGTAQ
jgi:hypothetical protein